MTLRSIAGIETPDSGRIIINGKTVFDSEEKINLKPQERRVGYLFQNYALFPTMTVEKNIACGYRGEKSKLSQKVADYIKRYHLGGTGKAFSVAAFWRSAAAGGSCAYDDRRAGGDSSG